MRVIQAVCRVLAHAHALLGADGQLLGLVHRGYRTSCSVNLEFVECV
jgi:hypothetical protein